MFIVLKMVDRDSKTGGVSESRMTKYGVCDGSVAITVFICGAGGMYDAEKRGCSWQNSDHLPLSARRTCLVKQ